MLELADVIKVTPQDQTRVVQMVLCVFSLVDFKTNRGKIRSYFSSVSLWKFEFSKDSVNTKMCLSLWSCTRISEKFVNFADFIPLSLKWIFNEFEVFNQVMVMESNKKGPKFSVLYLSSFSSAGFCVKLPAPKNERLFCFQINLSNF